MVDEGGCQPHDQDCGHRQPVWLEADGKRGREPVELHRDEEDDHDDRRELGAPTEEPRENDGG